MRIRLLLVLLALLSTGIAFAENAARLLLAGGHLPLCSSFSPRQCRDRTPAGLSQTLYQLDLAGAKRAAALDWHAQALHAKLLARSLGDASKPALKFEDSELLVTRLKRHAASFTAPDGSKQQLRLSQLWEAMTDDEQARLLDVLEVAQVDAQGARLREVVALEQSRNRAAVNVYREFVALARKAGGRERPRVLIVTASSRDPFAAIDYYLAAFEQAGAQATWLPLDAAVRGAREQGECARLAQWHASVLGNADRARIYPDWFQVQLAFCASQEGALAAIQQADGIFLNGGDQQLTKAAWISRGQPSTELKLLLKRVQAGALALGGTSAGSAVQSARGALGAMISGGESDRALSQGAHASAPAPFGCSRAKRCPNGLDPEQLTYDADGGLGSFALGIVDTHFAERGRWWRLARLQAERPKALAVGVDESTALVAEANAGIWKLRVVGAGHAWWIHAAQLDPAGQLVAFQLLSQGAGQILSIAEDADQPWPKTDGDGCKVSGARVALDPLEAEFGAWLAGIKEGAAASFQLHGKALPSGTACQDRGSAAGRPARYRIELRD